MLSTKRLNATGGGSDYKLYLVAVEKKKRVTRLESKLARQP